MKKLTLSIFIFLTTLLFCKCQKEPTYCKDIAPIIYTHCTPCHRPNQIGHFNLLTYNDVKSKATTINYCIQNNIMPPWPADPNYTSFSGENILTTQQKKLIDQWIKNACPLGNATDLPQMPNYDYTSFIGKPDLIIPIAPTLIKGNYTDEFLLIKVPFELPQQQYIHTIEIIPGNTKVVHHINADVVMYDDDKKKNVYDGVWKNNSLNDSTIKIAYKKMGILNDDNTYPLLHRNAANYLPGVIAQTYPEGIGDILLNKKNAFLLSDLHYGPSRNETWDSSYINIFFSKSPLKRPVQEFQLGTLGISPVLPSLIIPADSVMQVFSKYTLPKPISIVTINPHMHLIGKSFWAFATKPNGDTIPLIKIPKWDFNYQNFYKPLKAIVIPTGSTIYAVGIYDNTSKNLNNPFTPPRLIKDNNGSMRTTDEMFQFIISYLDYQTGDEQLKLDD
jgi:hypothetical protein